MATLTHDLRFALRTLAQRPGFTLVVAFTLALGIGAATVIFDLVNLFAWRRPAVTRPQQVAEVYTASRYAFAGAYGATSFPDYRDYREASDAFAGLAAYMVTYPSLATAERTRPAEAWVVSGNFFAVLGVPAALGRPLRDEDDRPGAPPVAVLGHDLWRELGADLDAISSTVRLSGVPFTVVGVAPQGFHGTSAGARPGVFVPSQHVGDLGDPNVQWLEDRSQQRFSLLGRLAPGVGLEQAAAELAIHARRLDAEHPVADLERRLTVKTLTLGHPIDQRNLLPTLRLFGAAVALLVLIVCANVANLQLSRAVARGREMGVRQALGAGRGRLVRQLMTESLLLAVAGSLGGLLLALWTRRLMVVYFGAELAADMRFDHRVLGLALLAAVAVTLLFGLAPACVTSRVDLVAALKAGTARAAGRRRLAAGPLLATAQVALSLVLVVSSVVLARSLWQQRSADLGFDTENLVLARVDLSLGRFDTDHGRELFRQLAAEAAALPGVQACGYGLLVPPVFLDVDQRLTLPGDPETGYASRFDFVDRGYFETLGLPLLRGRLFAPRDAAPAIAADGRRRAGTVVINQALAERLFPDGDAIGRLLRPPRTRPEEPGPDYEVIGVVGNVRQNRLSRTVEPVVYYFLGQRYRRSVNLVLRAEGDPAATFDGLRAILHRLAPNLTLDGSRTHAEHRWMALAEHRLQAQTVALFGAAGLLLALLGLFGVMRYQVSCRIREIGIRMALGARRTDVLRRVLRRGLTLAAAGLALGWLGSLWAVRVLQGMLPTQLGGLDPGTLITASIALLAACAVAVLLPARRASRIDPLTALRYE